MKGNIFRYKHGDKPLFLVLSDVPIYDQEDVLLMGIFEDEQMVQVVRIQKLEPILDFEKIHPLPKILKNYMD